LVTVSTLVLYTLKYYLSKVNDLHEQMISVG